MRHIFKRDMPDALISGVREVLNSEIIGVDPEDVKIILAFGNPILYSTQAVGINRSSIAIQQIIADFLKQNNLLSNVQGIMLSFSASQSLKMREVHEALDILKDAVPEDTYILVGAIVNNEMKEALRLTIIATGSKAQVITQLELN